MEQRIRSRHLLKAFRRRSLEKIRKSRTSVSLDAQQQEEPVEDVPGRAAVYDENLEAGRLIVTVSDSGKRTELTWLQEKDVLDQVQGAKLWRDAKHEEIGHRISSALLGLEGSAPNMESPFNVEHNLGGKSAKISAVGNRKWRAYRTNNALQIPSDFGGMRLKITRGHVRGPHGDRGQARPLRRGSRLDS